MSRRRPGPRLVAGDGRESGTPPGPTPTTEPPQPKYPRRAPLVPPEAPASTKDRLVARWAAPPGLVDDSPRCFRPVRIGASRTQSTRPRRVKAAPPATTTTQAPTTTPAPNHHDDIPSDHDDNHCPRTATHDHDRPSTHDYSGACFRPRSSRSLDQNR